MAMAGVSQLNDKATQVVNTLGIEPVDTIEDEYGEHALYDAGEVLAALESEDIFARSRRHSFATFSSNSGIEGDNDDEGVEDEGEIED